MNRSFVRYLVVTLVCLLVAGGVYAQQSFADLKPTDAQAQADYAKAQTAEAASNYDEAVRLYGLVIVREADFWPAYYKRGEAYSVQEKYQEAIVDYSSAVDKRSDFSPAYVARAIAYEQLGNHAKAIADSTKAIELKTNEDFVYFIRGKAYLATKEFEKSINDFTYWIDLNPKTYPVAYSLRSRAYYAVSNLPATISDLDIFIELQPKSALALSNRAYVQRLMGNYDKAISDYTTAIDLKPDGAEDMYYERGRTYGLQGQYDKMLADLRIYAKLAGSKADASVLDMLKNHPE